MSETDSFIQEVSEEVRQDRMFALWKRYAPYAVGAIAVIVAASAGWNWKTAQDQRAIEARGGAFIEAAEAGVAGQRALVSEMDGPAKVIAELRLAGALAASGDRAGAREVYAGVASSGAARQYTDLAKLNELRLAAATIPADDLIAALAPLLEEGAPYRPLALELRALARLNKADNAAARADLEALVSDPAVTQDTRARAAEALNLLRGAE